MSKLNQPFPNPLSTSRLLVFGGASGIGAAVASGALAYGTTVHVSSSQPFNIASATSKLQDLYGGSTVSGTPADLSQADTIEANVKAVLDAAVHSLGGPLDHIVFTAGDIPPRPKLADADAKEAMPCFQIRYIGPLMVAKHIAANPGIYLKAATTSSITLTSGIASRRPRPGITTAVGVAGAVEALTRALAVEMAPVRVNVVIPGAIRTELLEKLAGDDEIIKAFEKSSLLKTIGTPEDAAEAYLFCMRSSFATGQDYIVDGGLLYV